MTINLTTSLTIAEGEIYYGASGAVFYMEQYPDDFWFRNYGTIHAVGNGVTGFLGWNARGNFLNVGLIRIDSTGGISYGLNFQSWGPSVVNTGRIEFNGRGQAVRSWSVNQVFDNQGVVIATNLEGGATALWFRNSAILSNTGQILAYGPGSQAIFIDGFHYGRQTGPTTYTRDGYFENNGDVIAFGTGGGPTYALAISGLAATEAPTGPNIVNNGLMQADRAIWWVGSTHEYAAEWVENHGEMRGDIFLDNGDDRFISDGLYVGHIDVGSGDDIVDLARGTGAASINLGDGDDAAWGNRENETIDAGAGADLVNGGGGADWIYGNDGDDHLIGGGGADTLIGGFQRDLLEGGDGDDILIGDETYQTNYGFWQSSDRLFGGAGNDVLRGGQNDDYIDGGVGEDTAFFYGLRGSYEITTVDGVTTIRGPEGVDTLVGVERLEFFDGVYSIGGALLGRSTEGRSGDDVLNGDGADNRLRGGEGDDIITPGEGCDMIDGGDGNDVVWFEGRREDYKIVQVGDDWMVALNRYDTDYLTNVEIIRFRGGGAMELNRLYSGVEVLPGVEMAEDEAPMPAPETFPPLFEAEARRAFGDDSFGQSTSSSGIVDPIEHVWFW